jgi:hypothetical protein
MTEWKFQVSFDERIMNSQIRDFFRVDRSHDPHFKEVRFLSEEPDLDWKDVGEMGLLRSWFELSRISMADRIEFSREFWLGQFSFHPKATRSLIEFFDRLDDVAVVTFRQTNEEPWTSELIYSLGDNSCFFRGRPPANEKKIDAIKKQFLQNLPHDYWAFFRLHNGFGKLTELGLLPLENLMNAREQVINTCLQSEEPLRMGETRLDPLSLFPFYEVYGVGSFQCFNAEWYPSSEMGNIYFSGIETTVSDISDLKTWAENLAYPTFLEWLTAFLEGINRSP